MMIPSNSNSSVWMLDQEKFSSVETSSDKPVSCSVVVASKGWYYGIYTIVYTESGRIYHQGAIETDKCTDRNHISTIDANIVKKFKDPASNIKVRRATESTSARMLS